jgi:hypothetical protein
MGPLLARTDGGRFLAAGVTLWQGRLPVLEAAPWQGAKVLAHGEGDVPTTMTPVGGDTVLLVGMKALLFVAP